jgi:hypothetical protein
MDALELARVGGVPGCRRRGAFRVNPRRPVAGVFIKETMNNLADLGEKMGADPASWSSEPPAF